MEQSQLLNEDNYYQQTYGMDKATFEKRLNVGIAQCVLGITKDWKFVREELLARIASLKAQ